MYVKKERGKIHPKAYHLFQMEGADSPKRNLRKSFLKTPLLEEGVLLLLSAITTPTFSAVLCG